MSMLKNVEEVDVFIATEEGNFGFAYVYPKEDEYSAEMFQRRISFEALDMDLDDDDFWDCLNCLSGGVYGNTNSLTGAVQIISDYWNTGQIITEELPVHGFSSLKEAVLHFKEYYSGKVPYGTFFAVSYL